MLEKQFSPVDQKISFPDMEEKILSFWQKESVFERSVQQREGGQSFVFYDGPPFATGLPHFGHLVPGTLKDIFPRYKTMQGFHVPRRFGWDCHGLPVEYEAEKKLGISGNKQIEAYGVEKFNEVCRSSVLRYTDEWQRIVTRMGRWVDFSRTYKTMDSDYMESIWWVFQQLWNCGYIYSGKMILPYSPLLATPLSNFEVTLGGYRDVRDPAITVKFLLAPKRFLLAWTTTPWTLPSNLGLAVGEDLIYAEIRVGEEQYILLDSVVSRYFKDTEEYELLHRFPGKELLGLQYEPLFPYFADTLQAFVVHAGDFVNGETGTGIVHLAPGFGEDDFTLLTAKGLPVICPIDPDCRFTEEVPDFKGMFVKDADSPIIDYLFKRSMIVKKQSYLHSYPFCYRTDSPLIYRAVSSWSVRVTAIKKDILDANAKINWIPSHLQQGRFGKWLEGARDWTISRNRYWGNPIPVWQSEDRKYTEVIGSLRELEEKSGKTVKDLHKHVVDTLTWPSPDGKTLMRRVPEVLDCWFESGSMPYAQCHYPFENEVSFSERFPADFICEGLDQTRGWFYTLTVLAAALFKKEAFRNVVVNGLVLDKDMKKMSKSQRNFTDPQDVIKKYGADALRLFLMNSVVVQAENLKFTDEGVRDILKEVIIPLWNSFCFFLTYAQLDKVFLKGSVDDLANPLDQWIISETELLISRMTQSLDEYNVKQSINLVIEFIDMLSNWYIRRSRRRFWKSENDQDKQIAYESLYYVLLTVTKLIAPIVPFVSEKMYQSLRTDDMPISVHLCDFPRATGEKRNEELEEKMKKVRQLVRMGHALRRKEGIKNRQPLSFLYIVTNDEHERGILMEMSGIVREELNIKEIVFRQNEEDLVRYHAKPNYQVLGKKLGSSMRKGAQKILSMKSDEVRTLLEGHTLSIDIGEKSLDLGLNDIIVERREKENLGVMNEGTLTVGLNTHITEELNQEGKVREMVRVVQNLRKSMGLAVDDRIILRVEENEPWKKSVASFEEYLMEETLSQKIIWESSHSLSSVTIGHQQLGLTIEKV